MEIKEEIYVPDERKTPLVRGNKVFKSADDWSLTEKDLDKACIELGETEEKKERCLRELKEKLSGDENVRYRTDDSYLLKFLRVRKYDSEKAYQNMKQLYLLRKKKPYLFDIPENLKSLLDQKLATYFPYTDAEGKIIIYVNISRWNPDETSWLEVIQLLNILIDIMSANPTLQINGVVGLWEMEGLSVKHLINMLRNDPGLLSFVTLVQKCAPWRIKLLLATNTNRLTRILYAIVCRLLSRKLSERIFLLGSDINELHQHLDPEILPKELGGKLDDTDCYMVQHILDNVPYLRYERSFTSE